MSAYNDDPIAYKYECAKEAEEERRYEKSLLLMADENGFFDVIDEEDIFDLDNPEETLMKAYNKGRADTIDEILAFLKSKTWDEEEKAYIFNGSVLVPVNVLEDEIKQLKEKQNE